jgi:PAS domain S-box-containing protein
MHDTDDSIDVLHVDDDAEFADLVATFLEREDDRFGVESATAPAEAVDRLADRDFDCVVSDYDMPGSDGIGFLEAVRGEHPDLPFILYTGKGSEEVASEAISAGVTDYLQKGHGTGQYAVLANRIENAVATYHARRELADRERRLGLFFEQSPFGVIEWDEDFEFVRQNTAAERILGYAETELRGESWERIVPEADREDVSTVVSELLANRGGYRSTNENVRGDGERIVCEWHNRVVTDDDGDVVAVFSQFRDVTDRRRQSRRLDAVFNNTHTFAGLLEPDGTVIEANETVLSFGGLDREEMIGERLWNTDLVPPRAEARAAVRDAVERARGGESVREELRIRGADREAVVDFSIRPVTDERGEVTLLIPEGREITERKRKEEELKRRNDRLNELTGVISHDLRSPLNVAREQLELARGAADGDHEHLRKATRAVDRSVALLDDLLALAREGRRVHEPEPVGLGAATQRCWDAVATAGATLSVETNRTIDADGSRLEQLLENLVRNSVEHGSTGNRTVSDDSVEHGSTGSRPKADDAVEHGSTGNRTVSDDSVERDGAAVTVRVGWIDDGRGFYVADDGPGIPPDERETVFEAGYSTREDGTGMGLRIAREVAAAHGWEIDATTSEAGGARFEVTGVTVSDGDG